LPGAMRAANDGLRFVLELCLLAALAYGGYELGGDGAWRFVLAVGAPLLAAVLWGILLAPRSSHRVSDPWRLLCELALFGAAVVVLLVAGRMLLALVFAAAVAVHLAATFPLHQRRGSRSAPAPASE
jgi:Protein of unknown function (DUF2568)